jgi:hypothetical protein
MNFHASRLAFRRDWRKHDRSANRSSRVPEQQIAEVHFRSRQFDIRTLRWGIPKRAAPTVVRRAIRSCGLKSSNVACRCWVVRESAIFCTCWKPGTRGSRPFSLMPYTAVSRPFFAVFAVVLLCHWPKAVPPVRVLITLQSVVSCPTLLLSFLSTSNCTFTCSHFLRRIRTICGLAKRILYDLYDCTIGK